MSISYLHLYLHGSFADLFLFRKQMEQIVSLHNVYLSRPHKYLPAVVYFKIKYPFICYLLQYALLFTMTVVRERFFLQLQ